MGEHKHNQNSVLKAQGKAPDLERPLKADIMVNADTRKLVIVYDRHINNVSYTPEQLEHHIKGLIGACRILDAQFMDGCEIG